MGLDDEFVSALPLALLRAESFEKEGFPASSCLQGSIEMLDEQLTVPSAAYTTPDSPIDRNVT